MPKCKINDRAVSDPSWWHWFFTVPLLGLNLAGYHWAMVAAMVLCVVAGCYFYWRIRQWKPYPVQVRIAYLIWSLVGMLPGMQWMLWIQLFGTSAMVAVGYCPLIRMLSLLPHNRTSPLSLSLIQYAFLKAPCAGGLLAWPESLAESNCANSALDSTKDSTELPLSCAIPQRVTSTKVSEHANAY